MSAIEYRHNFPFETIEITAEACILRHTLEMNTNDPAFIFWPFVFRPLHNALIEDSLAFAQANLGQQPLVYKWSPWVKLLRWLVSKGQARAQVTPDTAVRSDTPDVATR